MLRPTGPTRQSNRQPSEFEALRHNERLLPATSVIIQSGSETRAVAITGAPEVPPADPDREVIWTVGVSAVRFDLSALLAKPEVASTIPLDSTNAVVYSMGSTLLPFRTTVGWDSEFTTPRGRSVYVINATDDGTVRNIKLSLQREYTIQNKDALFVSGNNKPIKANTTFELRAWI